MSRSKGYSAVASAAYRSADKLTNEYDGIEHDYTRREGVVHSEIMLPENAPERYRDRATLWNAVEQVEKGSKAQLAREFEMALPRELTREEQIQFVREFVHEQFVKKGMCADWSIHDKGDGNPHVHIMLTTRSIQENGEWAAKEIKVFSKDENGERIPVIDPKTGEQKVDSRNRKQWKREYVQTNTWNRKELLQETRANWAAAVNRELERKGLPDRIDHRTLKAQGIDRLPTIHEGKNARVREEKRQTPEGREKYKGETDRIEINRDVKQTNEKIAEVKMTMAEVQQSIGIIREDMAWSKVHEGAGDLRIFIRENGTSEAAMQQAYQKLDKLESMAADNVRAAQQTNFHGMPYLEYHVGKSEHEREWMEDRINENLAFIRSVPYHEQYTYGQVDMQRLNETFRADRGEDGYINIAKRTPAEQAVVRDVKKADAELSARYDTSYLRQLIAQQAEAQKLRRPTKSRDEELVRQIQESFANLKFMEQHKIYSGEQARVDLKAIEGMHADCLSQIKEAEGIAAKLEAVVQAPYTLKEISNRVEQNRNNPEYMKNQYQQDVKLMKSAADTMKQSGITTTASLKEAKAAIEQYKEQIEELKTLASDMSAKLEGYKRCVAVLDRIEGRVPEQIKSQPTAATVEPKKQAAPEQAKSQPAAATVEVQKGQPKTVQQPEPERTQQSKAAAFDVQGVAKQLAAHRAAFIQETVQSQQTMKAYQMNTTYTEKATRIEDLNRERKDLIAQKEQKQQQIENLGRNPFKARERTKLEGQAAEYTKQLEGVEKNLSAELEAMGYSGKDLDKAEAAVKDLRQRAAEERQQAQQSRGSGEAGKRAEEAKAAYLAAAKAVPEEQKQAVAAAMAKLHEQPEKMTPEIYKAEQAAKQQLDTALKPEPQQKEQPEQDREPQGKESKQKTWEEVKAEIAKERQAQKLNPTKDVERSTTKGWTHEGR